MATDFLNADASNMMQIYAQSEFLASMRQATAKATRGCILMEDPARVVELLRRHPVRETTTRGTAMDEYVRMTSLPSHDMEPEHIAELSRPYRWLKRNYFFGFGAYG